MINIIQKIKVICFLFLVSTLPAQLVAQSRSKAPIMGWSSWNNFRIHIDEKLIKQQADMMITSGLYDAGYRFINIDDGFFRGRDSSGKLLIDTVKFPSGMKSLADYIHSKNLSAGIYTDAGINTCGSIYDKDKNGIGSGIYGHINEDLSLFFKEWGYDFIKVDWCGGEKMKLNEEKEYTQIIKAVKAINQNLRINVCRWKFPGEWAVTIADSWRISSDISANFNSIQKIIDLNTELYKYSTAGHYNDMDMLQVGRGMSYEEDKTHFSMWCILNSPLLAGNDLRSMTKETISILTNKEIIALNQDKGFKQAQKTLSQNGVEIWQKDLGKTATGKKAVAIMNRNNVEKTCDFSAEQLSIPENSNLRDLWLHQNIGKMGKKRNFILPPHGVIVLKSI